MTAPDTSLTMPVMTWGKAVEGTRTATTHTRAIFASARISHLPSRSRFADGTGKAITACKRALATCQGTFARSLSLFLSRRRFSESCRVYGHVRLDFVQLRGIAAVEPRELVLEGELDAADLAIVVVVDLRGHAADRGGSVPDQA